MFEYKRYVYYVGSHIDHMAELNALAKEGWRVINMRVSFSPGEAEIYTLEREVKVVSPFCERPDCWPQHHAPHDGKAEV